GRRRGGVAGVGSWNLISAFNYYLVLAFVVGTALRGRNYLAMIGLVARSADRWPKLRALVATHRGIFLRWPTVLPVAATLALAPESGGRRALGLGRGGTWAGALRGPGVGGGARPAAGWPGGGEGNAAGADHAAGGLYRGEPGTDPRGMGDGRPHPHPGWGSD